MNTTHLRPSPTTPSATTLAAVATATVAAATVAAAAVTALSAVTSTSASAHRADPFPGSATRCVGGVGGVCTVDIALEIAHRKALMAQYHVDHALELQQRAAR